MRRILRKIAASEYEGLGDISTLADREVLAALKREHLNEQFSIRRR